MATGTIKLKALPEKIPLTRLGMPNDLAGTDAFVAPADADFVTGNAVFV